MVTRHLQVGFRQVRKLGLGLVLRASWWCLLHWEHFGVSRGGDIRLRPLAAQMETPRIMVVLLLFSEVTLIVTKWRRLRRRPIRRGRGGRWAARVRGLLRCKVENGIINVFNTLLSFRTSHFLLEISFPYLHHYMQILTLQKYPGCTSPVGKQVMSSFSTPCPPKYRKIHA